MALLNAATNQQTVTVATEVALATLPFNPANIPPGDFVVVYASAYCAAGTGGTTAQLKLRQGVGTGGAALTTWQSPAATAGVAQNLSVMYIDFAPPSSGQYTLTLTYTGNTSSAVSSGIFALSGSGALEA